jgi:hypothetical protein
VSNAPQRTLSRRNTSFGDKVTAKKQIAYLPPKIQHFKKIGKNDGEVRVPNSTPAYQKLGSYDERGPSYGQKTFLGPDSFWGSPPHGSRVEVLSGFGVTTIV